MHTFSKDGVTVHYSSDLSGEIYVTKLTRCESLTIPLVTIAVPLPPGYLQEWLRHAGFVVIPEDVVQAYFNARDAISGAPDRQCAYGSPEYAEVAHRFTAAAGELDKALLSSLTPAKEGM